MRRKIYCTSDCNGYWYHARHGVGPGTIPRDVHLLKVVEDPENSWKDYFLLDRALTSDELAEYDLKEKCPPQVTAAKLVNCSSDDVDIDVTDYYERMSPEDEADAYSFIDDVALANMGYAGYHILGWYSAKPEYAANLLDQGLSEMMLIDDGSDTFFGYVVGGRLFELEPYDIAACLDD